MHPRTQRKPPEISREPLRSRVTVSGALRSLPQSPRTLPGALRVDLPCPQSGTVTGVRIIPHLLPAFASFTVACGNAPVEARLTLDAAVELPAAPDAPADTLAPLDDTSPVTQPDAPPLDDVVPVDTTARDASVTETAVVDPCVGRSGRAGRTTLQLPWGGRMRSAVVNVPAGYDGRSAVPLVLALHGFLDSGGGFAAYDGLEAEGARRGIVVVHPDGLNNSWNAGACCGQSAIDSVDDVGFLRSLLDRVATNWCIDRARVYATGFSNGGAMSHRLGCELSDRIAAIAPVSGTLGLNACHPERPVPVFHTHGDADIIVLYNGGGLSGLQSVASTMSTWRTVDMCPSASATTRTVGSARCETWNPCAGGVETTLCTIGGGPHVWPAPGFPAPREIFDFFARHRLP